MQRTNSSAMQILQRLILIVACRSAFAADSPGKLRTEMTKAEKAYIDLYNKVNTDPQFAIICRMDTPTGSNFAVRVCQPRYLLHAAEKSATERMQSAVAAGDATGPANANGPNVGAASGGGAAAVSQDKDEAFRQNMLGLLQKSPELQALAKKRDELQARYAEATKGKGDSKSR